MSEPETEVLRIEGNLVISKEIHGKFRFEFINLLSKLDIEWVGSIVPQDSSTGMRLYRVEEVEGYKSQIAQLVKTVESLQMADANNDINLLTVTEQLRQEKEKYDKLNSACSLTLLINKGNLEVIEKCYTRIKVLEKRLELKDSPIKAGLKRAWKWFKGLVGK